MNSRKILRMYPITALMAFSACFLATGSAQGQSDRKLLDLLVEHGYITQAQANEVAASDREPQVVVQPKSSNVKELRVRGRIQGQFGYVDTKNEAGSEDWSTLELRRVRLGVEGKLYQDYKFKVEANLLPNAISMRAVTLEWTRFDEASLLLGFEKPVFGFEEITSSAAILTVERSLISNTFAPGPLTGAHVYGTPGMFTYSLGVVTSELNTNRANEASRYVYNGSVGVVLDHLVPDGARLRFRADTLQSDDSGGRVAHDEAYSVSGHFALGRFDLRAEYLAGKDFNGDWTDGFYVMPSWFFMPKLQGVVRYERSTSDAPDGLRAPSRYVRRAPGITGGAQRGDIYEALYVGANYYVKGNDLKFMGGVEFSELDNTAEGTLESTTLYGAVRMLF